MNAPEPFSPPVVHSIRDGRRIAIECTHNHSAHALVQRDKERDA